MWGEVKFWFSRYKTWVFVGLGLVGITLLFLLISSFSANEDRQMARQVQEVEETQQVIEEQQVELLGNGAFSSEVNALPTESIVTSFLDEQEWVNDTGDYLSERSMDKIEEEYGEPTRILAQEGYLLSDGMTADQRVIVQLKQEQLLFAYGDIDESDLVSVVVEDYASVGLPKPIFNVRKYLGQRVSLENYTFGIFNSEEYEPSDNLLFSHSTHTGEIEIAYIVDEEVNLGDVTLIGGYVAKGQHETTGGKTLYAYLLFKPNRVMTGQEYSEAIKELDIQLNNSELSFREDVDEFVEELPSVFKVQMTDGLFYYTDEDGYDSNDAVTLDINNKNVAISVAGTNFEVPVETK